MASGIKQEDGTYVERVEDPDAVPTINLDSVCGRAEAASQVQQQPTAQQQDEVTD